MFAQNRSQLHTHTQYARCTNCGAYQQRDFDNPCMYCNSKQFIRVYGAAEFNENELR